MHAESADQAALVLPLIVMCFFFSRGMLVSAVFLRARGKSRVSSKELRGSKRNGQGVFATGLTSSREAAEHLASTMGFCGQMGALSGQCWHPSGSGCFEGAVWGRSFNVLGLACFRSSPSQLSTISTEMRPR